VNIILNINESNELNKSRMHLLKPLLLYCRSDLYSVYCVFTSKALTVSLVL